MPPVESNRLSGDPGAPDRPDLGNSTAERSRMAGRAYRRVGAPGRVQGLSQAVGEHAGNVTPGAEDARLAWYLNCDFHQCRLIRSGRRSDGHTVSLYA